MNRTLAGLMVVFALLPFTVQAQTAGGSWQVYTVASGLREWPSQSIAPDGAGGVWVGHQSSGRGLHSIGGLSHIRADGSSQTYGNEEPFQSCSSVDALAAAANGGLWMQLSGLRYYGYNDALQQCRNNYGVTKAFPISGTNSFDTVALGYISADGVPQMVAQELLPTTITRGLAVDAAGRPWVGTTRGAAVREPDGTWRDVVVWNDAGTTSAVSSAGPMIMLGSSTGDVAIVEGDAARLLPRPTSDTSQPVNDIAAGVENIGTIIGNTFYRWNGSVWTALALPGSIQFAPDQTIYGQSVAYAGGTFWVNGLYRLDGTAWTAFASNSTPLPSSNINDLVAADSTTLLIATDQGAAKLNTAGPAPDPRAAQAAFTALWQRTNLNAQGGWVWGPRVWAERYEGYTDGAGGYRFVRYYDKARMEVSDQQADPNSQWYVTNGLLVQEMVRGQTQFSNDPALAACPLYYNTNACPSGVPVAGDIDYQSNALSPNYGDFAAFLAPVEQRSGQRVGATLSKAQSYAQPTLGQDAGLATVPTTLDSYDAVTQHNIPRAFWDFMRVQPVDWLYTFGHPISEPYWIRATIGGNEQRILVQLFERRTLTYTPANQPPWQVEMGNVGQHYYQWRYGAYENPPWAE